jgi:crossover junction endodeoxyribonuclease RusA
VEMTPSLSVRLPLPPSSNNCYVNVAGKGRVLTSEARNWQMAATALTRAALREQGPPPLPPLVISMFVYFPNRRRDVSNAIKLAEDAVCGALAINDRYVHEIHVYRLLSKDNPRLDIVISTSNLEERAANGEIV